jgi:hypothetical protein
MLKNAAKANFTIEELGWRLQPIENLEAWDGLTVCFLRQYRERQESHAIGYLRRWRPSRRRHAIRWKSKSVPFRNFIAFAVFLTNINRQMRPYLLRFLCRFVPSRTYGFAPT